jgi:hypothetical protein
VKKKSRLLSRHKKALVNKTFYFFESSSENSFLKMQTTEGKKLSFINFNGEVMKNGLRGKTIQYKLIEKSCNLSGVVKSHRFLNFLLKVTKIFF